MIELVTTAESIEQAKKLIDAGVNTLYIGEDKFGLRLPNSFSRRQIKEITELAHKHEVNICVAVNALMHNDRIADVLEYLQFLESINVDRITLGDPGIVHIIKQNKIELLYVYDAQTMVTSSKVINFWKKRGATGAVLARELTYEELQSIGARAEIPAEVLVYGATCIHHSKRRVVENYFNFTDGDKSESKDLYLAEPKNVDTHYSIYEDLNGTHVFATNDINLLPELSKLLSAGLKSWKLDGLYTKGEDFVRITELFVKAKHAAEKNELTNELLENLTEQLLSYHPKARGLDQGFFVKKPDDVK